MTQDPHKPTFVNRIARLIADRYGQWRLRRDTELIEASGAFHRAWYLKRYPDVAGADIDPLRHYVISGCREGRFPNPIFDTAWYLAHYFPGAADPPNALADYLRRPGHAGRRPNRWFDPAWYRRQAKDVSSRDPMLHYLAAGRGAKAPSPDVDLTDLTRRNPDLGGHGTPLGFFLNDYRVIGCLGDCTSYYIGGWASRVAGPEIVLTVVVNGRSVGHVTPWIDRPDVQAALAITGLGFCFVFPTRLSHGNVVELHDEFGQTVIGCVTTYEVPPLGTSSAFYPNRASIAATFLTGRGVEIGAFTQPNDLPPDREIAFYDRYPSAVLHQFYDDTCGRPLMEPNYVGDAETLDALEDGSFDFLIANHVIEHLQDPIRFLKSIAAKLKPGGRALIAAPDKRFCMDHPRSLTPFDHLVADHDKGPELSQRGHFLQYIEEAGGMTGQAAIDWVDTTDMADIRFHYHVWDAKSFVGFILATIDHYAMPLALLHSDATKHDIIVVLEKSAGAAGSLTRAIGSRAVA